MAQFANPRRFRRNLSYGLFIKINNETMFYPLEPRLPENNPIWKMDLPFYNDVGIHVHSGFLPTEDEPSDDESPIIPDIDTDDSESSPTDI